MTSENTTNTTNATNTAGTRFYCGAKLDHAPIAARIIQILTEKYGWQVTYDWTGYLEREKDADVATYICAATEEAVGVISADLVIFYLPGGRGAWCELGIALGAHPKSTVYLAGPIGDKDPPVFFYHPRVRYLHEVDPERIADRLEYERAQQVWNNT